MLARYLSALAAASLLSFGGFLATTLSAQAQTASPAEGVDPGTCSPVEAAADATDISELSPELLEAAQAEVGDATFTSFGTEDGVTEVMGTLPNGCLVEVDLMEDRTVEEVETQVPFAEIPQSCLDGIGSALGGDFTVDFAEISSRPDGMPASEVCEIEVTGPDEMAQDFEVNPDTGEVISQEPVQEG